MNKYFFLSIFQLTMLGTVVSQKLPQTQTIGVIAPSSVIIDGIPNEWGNKFQAYNKAAGIFYTIANDSKNLYLLIHITNKDIIRKATVGGVVFTINSSDKKNDKTGITICYPKYDKNNLPLFLVPESYPKNNHDTLRSRLFADSCMRNYNKKLFEKIKQIGVTGLSNVQDSVLSVYNEENIKAASLFDSQLTYTYELSIPLIYINLKINDFKHFNYRIQINSVAVDGFNVHNLPGRNKIVYTRADGKDYEVGPDIPATWDLISSTNFKGEYTLAKKP